MYYMCCASPSLPFWATDSSVADWRVRASICARELEMKYGTVLLVFVHDLQSD